MLQNKCSNLLYKRCKNIHHFVHYEEMSLIEKKIDSCSTYAVESARFVTQMSKQNNSKELHSYFIPNRYLTSVREAANEEVVFTLTVCISGET